MARTMMLAGLVCLTACSDPLPILAVPEIVAVESDSGVHIVAMIKPIAGQTGHVSQVRVIDGNRVMLGAIDLPPDAEVGRNFGRYILAPIDTKGVTLEMDIIEGPGKPQTVGVAVGTERFTFTEHGEKLDKPPPSPRVAWCRDTAGVHIACTVSGARADEATALMVKDSAGAVLGRRERAAGTMSIYLQAPAELQAFDVVVEWEAKHPDGQPWPITSTRHVQVER